jgi:hypothetical protein
MSFLKQLVDSKNYIDDVNGLKVPPIPKFQSSKDLIQNNRIAQTEEQTTTNPEIPSVQIKPENVTVDLNPSDDLFKPSI